jgi:hypothetical protein
MTRLVTCVIAILSACAAGLCAPAEARQGQAAAATPESAPLRVAVFGDSLADGLWSGVYRSLRRDRAISEVARLAQASTGLTNYTYVDVAERTREQLVAEDYDVAIVMFGANDIQGIAIGGRVHRFRTPGWEEVYRDRVRELIGLLRADGAAVYWVGLPRMRSDRYDGNTIYLNSIFRSEASALGVPFIETREVSAGDEGEYVAYLPDPAGTPRLVRADDGIHFTLRGYNILASPLVTRLREDMSAINEMRRTRMAGNLIGPDAVRYGLVDELLIDVYGRPYVCEPAQVEIAEGEGAGSGSAP